MNNKYNKKILLAIIISSLFFSPLILAKPTYASTVSNKLNWEKPNGPSPYKVTVKNIKNTLTDPQLYVDLIGCTGAAERVAGSITKLIKNPVGTIVNTYNDVMDFVCETATASLGSGTSAVPIAGAGLSQAITDLKVCNEKSKDRTAEKATIKQTESIDSQNTVENCLNAIAVSLAKKQLVEMTKNTMNWINTGFGGDPLYVTNTNRLMTSITDRILTEEINFFKNADPYDYPYGRDYARSLSSSYLAEKNFRDSLKFTLGNYIQGNSSDVLNNYSNDFASGGWDAWLGFTQFDQNNPIGFNIMASDKETEEEEKKVQEQKEELAYSDGILSPKKCVKHATTKGDEKQTALNALSQAQSNLSVAQKKYDEAVINYSRNHSEENNSIVEKTNNGLSMAKTAYDKALSTANSLNIKITDTEEEECLEWEVVTPGSLIKDTISEYITSPARQTEMVKSINDLLYSLFNKMFSKFQTEGLASLEPSSDYNFKEFGGFGSNQKYKDTENNLLDNISFDIYEDQNSRPFDITKDLGNSYIYEKPTKLGTWDAYKNETEEIDGSKKGLFVGIGNKNSYYVVSKAGKTKIFGNNYLFFERGWSGWVEGDIAYFDGIDWRQYSKKEWDTGNLHIIDKKGVIQEQQDYINVAQKTLEILNKLLPAYGELDYCIPGPNPNWKNNSAEPYQFLVEFISNIKPTYTMKDNGEKVDYTEITSPEEYSSAYKNYENVFKRNDGSEPQSNAVYGSLFKEVVGFGKSGWADTDNSEWGCGTLVACFIDVFTGREWPADSNPLDWNNQKGANEARDRVNVFFADVVADIDIFYDGYTKYIKKVYGDQSPMLNMSKAIEVAKIRNESYENYYLDWAITATNKTKDILDLDIEIYDLKKEYEDGIQSACSNIYALNKIRLEVENIIKIAQNRRNERLKKEGIVVPENCQIDERGTYIYDGDIQTSGCFNAGIDSSLERKTIENTNRTRGTTENFVEGTRDNN